MPRRSEANWRKLGPPSHLEVIGSWIRRNCNDDRFWRRRYLRQSPSPLALRAAGNHYE